MTRLRAAASRTLALALLTGSIGGCGLGGAIAQPGQPDDAGEPRPVLPKTQVLAGVGPDGPYRLSVYRTTDGHSCLELDTPSMNGAGCGPEVPDVIGPNVSFNGDATWIAGGTDQAAAQAIRVRFADGSRQETRALSAPTAIAPGIRFYVIVLPPIPRPESLEVVSASGEILTTWGLE